MIEWDITQWVDLHPSTDDTRPEGGLSYMAYSAMGPDIPEEHENGEGWLMERPTPMTKFQPRPNHGDGAYLSAMLAAEFPTLGKHRLFLRFDSDISARAAQIQPPRQALIADWLNKNCQDGEIVWASVMISNPFGGIALVALHSESDFLLAKLRFKEVYFDPDE